MPALHTRANPRSWWHRGEHERICRQSCAHPLANRSSCAEPSTTCGPWHSLVAFVAWFFGVSLRSAWLRAMKRRSRRYAKWYFCNRTVWRLRPNLRRNWRHIPSMQRSAPCMEETCIMFARKRNFYEIMATLASVVRCSSQTAWSSPRSALPQSTSVHN